MGKLIQSLADKAAFPVVNRQFVAVFMLTLALMSGLSLIQPLTTPASPHSALTPHVQIAYRYYPISGMTASELRSHMNQLGPRDHIEGRTYDARTDWAVKWSYRYSMRGGQCAMQSVVTQVEVTFTLPRWTGAGQAERSLRAHWKHYQAALQHHEEGHKQHGIEAGYAVQRSLSQLPRAASCTELEATAQTTARAVIKTYNQKDLDYDRVTRHGFTQGAVFPTATTVSRPQEFRY